MGKSWLLDQDGQPVGEGGGGRSGAQVTEMDGAVNAFQTTVSGVDGDSLLSSLPTVVKDLERIDTAWTSLEGQIDRDCG